MNVPWTSLAGSLACHVHYRDLVQAGEAGRRWFQTFQFSWLGIELSLSIIVIKYPPHLISLLLLSYPSAPFGFFLSFAFILALDTLGSSFVIVFQ